MLRITGLLIVLLLLGSCASLSNEECQLGDWTGIGLADGAAGRGVAYIEAHRKACAEVGVTPDLTAWQAGRLRGLEQYCTPQNAYQVGRAGRQMTPVCTPRAHAAMLQPYAHGQRYHDISRDIADLEHEINSLEAEMSGLARDGLTPEERAVHARLMLLKSQYRARIMRLQQQRRAYASWT